MTTVSITGWQPGFETISFMKLLREGSQSQRTLAEAKLLVDGLLRGKPFEVTFPSRGEAETFVRFAANLGVIGVTV